MWCVVGSAIAGSRTSASAASTLTWAVFFYVLALFFNYPHYMATIYRAYHTKADFEKYRIFTVHITSARSVDRGFRALLASRPPLDFYRISDRESLALQRAELRALHDVCPAGWRPA